jgi:hypothetical protein
MTDDEIIRLGHSAENILASEAFKVAMEDVEKFNIECWANGQFKTPQEREEAYGLVRGARTFKGKLEAMLANMKLSKAQAERRVELRR